MRKEVDTSQRTAEPASGGDYVIGPLGSALTLADLPPLNTHWVPRKKAEVVCAVRGGLLSAEEACDRYRLSLEEFADWCVRVEAAGLRGLQVTKSPGYRRVGRQQSG